MLLISSCTKPYLPAELTLENLSAVLASFIYRSEHVPENIIEVCYSLNTFNIYNTCQKMAVYKFMCSIIQKLVHLAGVVVKRMGLSLTAYV